MFSLAKLKQYGQLYGHIWAFSEISFISLCQAVLTFIYSQQDITYFEINN